MPWDIDFTVFFIYNGIEQTFIKTKERMSRPLTLASVRRLKKVLPMKYNNTFFMQVSREIWNRDLSDRAKLLFLWLNELEQRYTSTKQNYFYRTDEQLAEDMGWNIKTVRKVKAELKATDLIRTSRVRFIDKDKKRSTFWMTGYTIMR